MRRTTVRVVGPAAVLAAVATGALVADQTWSDRGVRATTDRFGAGGQAVPTPRVPVPSAIGTPSSSATSVSVTPGLLEIQYTFARQPRAASNQFSIWVETADGAYVDTVFVTSWIANGGWQLRPMAMPDWRDAARWPQATQAEIEQASRPAPSTGTHTVYWDGLDYAGSPLPAGDYVLRVEGNIEWENMVAFEAPFRIGSSTVDAGVSTITDDQPDDVMLSDVHVRWRAGEQVTPDMTTEFTRGS